MKARPFRSRMPTAIRDWFTQLLKSRRHNWEQMSRRFRKLYIGTTGSYSERYFTMKMTDHETHDTAVKAEVKFKSISKLPLEGHRFQSITDLERALRRHEDVWCEQGYTSPAPKKPSDFRTDNVHRVRAQIRGPARRRAFVAQGDVEPAQDSVFQHEPQSPEVFVEQADAHSKSIPELSHNGNDGEVFLVAENQHWKSRSTYAGQCVARPEKWDVFCEKCKKWGQLLGRGYI
ncbi:LOW QUALITY PROTEIN: hypothetical protein PHMEG_00014738 [Phytophthora megakarya]|uniref:Uncharacterized protein n=1 Tax=Phytophthora megakarya TaxID=4795 RepID=A0A225W3K8_9STRA|nr:LOW QUALITY PROTEIN: hypothetical protein PHMEG_00014738 [Phytophthora megakarya]